MPSKFHRRSIRLPGFDYASENSYFLTLVTNNRRNLFGELHDHRMILSGLGEIVRKNWAAIPAHFSNAEVDEFVIMPNHLHGIINLFDDHRRGTIYLSLRSGTHKPWYRAPTEAFGQPVHGSIPTILRTFKASVTRHAREELGERSVWQRNYYEHIIGFDSEYDEIVEYIHSNPINWLMDDEFSP